DGEKRQRRLRRVARPDEVIAPARVTRIPPRDAEAGDDGGRKGSVLVRFEHDGGERGLVSDGGGWRRQLERPAPGGPAGNESRARGGKPLRPTLRPQHTRAGGADTPRNSAAPPTPRPPAGSSPNPTASTPTGAASSAISATLPSS